MLRKLFRGRTKSYTEDESESSSRENESSSRENESSVKENESSVKENESSIKENESSAKDGETETFPTYSLQLSIDLPQTSLSSLQNSVDSTASQRLEPQSPTNAWTSQPTTPRVNEDRNRSISALVVPLLSAPAFFSGSVSRDLFVNQMSSLTTNSLVDGLSRTYDLTQQLSKVLSMINKLSAETDITSAVTSIVESAYSLVQAEKFTVYIVDYTTGEIVNPIPGPEEVSRAPLGTGLVGHSAMWGETINIKDAYQDRRFLAKIDESKGIRAKSILCIPVRDHLGRTVAVLQATNKILEPFTGTIGHFTRDDQSITELIANCTGNALGKIQLVSRMELFMEMLKTLSAEIEPDSVIQRIISSTYELLRCERVTLFLVDEERQMLTMAVSKDAEGFSLPMSKGIVGHVSRTGEVVNIPNAYDDSRFDPATDKATGFKTKSILCVPVRSPSGQIIAVIQSLNKLFGIFHGEDETFLQSMAAHAGLALWKSKLYNENLVARRRSEALLGMVRSVYESDDIRELFRKILVCIENILFPERASLVLVDAVTGELWLAVSQDAEGAKIPSGKGIVAHVIKSKQSIRVADAYQDERFNSEVDKATGLRTKTLLCSPVVDNKSGKAIAAIQAINKGVGTGREPQPFTEEDQELLEVLCLEVATALKRKSLEMAYSNAVNKSTRERTTSESRAVTSFLVYAGSTEQTSFVSSVSMKGTQTFKMMKWPSSNEIVEQGAYRDWDFNPWSLDESKLLVVIERIFDELGCLAELKLDQNNFQRFLIQLRSMYHPNPFHNFVHAFSVLHQAYLILVGCPFYSQMNRTYVTALAIAALGHDLDHPGHTNQYEINTRSKLALRYNDVSVLESHHTSMLVKLIENPEVLLFRNLSTEESLNLRKIIVDAILHTDMAKHFDLVSKLKTMCANSTAMDTATPAQAQFVVNTLLHCGDLSGQTLQQDLALKWGELVMQEFANQAAAEREQNLPVAPFMEKLTEEKDRATLQLNFADYVLKPMWEAVSELLPHLRPRYQNLLGIREHYQRIIKPT